MLGRSVRAFSLLPSIAIPVRPTEPVPDSKMPTARVLKDADLHFNAGMGLLFQTYTRTRTFIVLHRAIYY